MKIKELSVMDLSNAKIGDFLTELERALANSEYSDVKDAIQKINDYIIAPGIIRVEKDGIKTIEITDGTNTERINITELSKAIKSRIQNDIDSHTITGTAISDRDEILNKMDEFLTGMFNQDKLYSELIGRGYSFDKFKEQVEKENEKSRDKIKILESKKKSVESAAEAFIGKDIKITKGTYTRKSLSTKLNQSQKAMATLELIGKHSKALNQAKIKLAAETDADKIKKLEADIKSYEKKINYLADELKKCDIDGMDPDIFKDFEKITDSELKNKIKAAKKQVRKEFDAIYTTLEEICSKKLSQSQKDELGITPDIEAKIAECNSTDKKKKKDARKFVAEFVKNITKTISDDIQPKISLEQRLIELREKNIDKYKEMDAKIKEFDSKSTVVQGNLKDPTFLLDKDGNKIIAVDPETGNQCKDKDGKPVYVLTEYVQKLDGSGKPVYVDEEPQYETVTDANGNTFNKPRIRMTMLPDGSLTPAIGPVGSLRLVKDKNGNYGYEYVYEFKEITDKKYKAELLSKAGFDEKKETKRIEAKYLTRKEKRKAINAIKARGVKVGSKLGTLLFPGRQWKKYNLTEYILEDRKKTVIKNQQNKDFIETISLREDMGTLQRAYERAKNSAEIQQQLYSAGIEQGRNPDTVDKSQLIEALDNSAYEEALYLAAIEGKDEIHDIRVKKNGNTNASKSKLHEDTVKSHVEGIQKEDKRLVHENSDDMEL